MGDVNDVPVIGQPLVYGVGFIVLLLVTLTDSWGRSLVTVAHEGGHMVMAVLTFRGFQGFRLDDGGGGGTTGIDRRWGVGELLNVFSGYPAPCLLGLGGAAVVADGNARGVLWGAIVLLLAGFLVALNALAIAVTLVALVALVWIAIAASPTVQAAVAVALVWWLLIGGAFWSTVGLSRGDGSDAAAMASNTLVPRVVWHVVWGAIGILALVAGGRLLLLGDAWPDGLWPLDVRP